MSALTRYSGEDLDQLSHIVVLGSCKVGISLSVHRSSPEASLLDAIGFIRQVTADFESALTELDWRCSWDDSTAGAGVRLMQLLEQKLTSW